MDQLLYLSLISTPYAADVASLALRFFAGAAFVAHGRPKLFGAQRQQARGFMRQLGVPGGLFDAITVLEVFGGIFLILGLLTPLLSVLFLLEMAGTTSLQLSKFRKPPTNVKYIGGWEIDTYLFAIALALVFLGPGLVSLDYLIGF